MVTFSLKIFVLKLRKEELNIVDVGINTSQVIKILCVRHSLSGRTTVKYADTTCPTVETRIESLAHIN